MVKIKIKLKHIKECHDGISDIYYEASENNLYEFIKLINKFNLLN